MSTSKPLHLFPGERLVPGANGASDLLVAEGPGAHAATPERPLVVILPGAVHLARIAYATGDLPDDDFLLHWLGEAGHPSLAVSYPLAVAEPVFDHVDPRLDFTAYTEAVANLIAAATIGRNAPPEVVVAGWSAAGNVAPRLAVSLAARGVALRLFVALAATPPLPNLVLGSRIRAEEYFARDDALTPEGLLAHRTIRSFTPELDALRVHYGRDVLPEAHYEHHILGDMPLNLFPGLDTRYENDGTGRATVDPAAPIAVSAGMEWADYPLVGVVQPDGVLDARHALTDHGNWAMINLNVLALRHLAGVDLDQLSPGRWQGLRQLADEIPELLRRRVDGGHMFFIGREGAQTTAEHVRELAAAASDVGRRLHDLLVA